MGHSPVPVPSGQSFCLSRGCPSVRGWWRRDPGWWRRPLHKELPEGAAPSSQTGPGLLYEGDLCAELCLQALPQLLYRVEGGRFKFLGEILERAGCWARGGQRKGQRKNPAPAPKPAISFVLSYCSWGSDPQVKQSLVRQRDQTCQS